MNKNKLIFPFDLEILIAQNFPKRIKKKTVQRIMMRGTKTGFIKYEMMKRIMGGIKNKIKNNFCISIFDRKT